MNTKDKDPPALGSDAAPYSAPFTTDVPQCCESPETCPEPCAPPPASVPDGCKAMRDALLAVRMSVRFKSLSTEQRALIDSALATTPEESP